MAEGELKSNHRIVFLFEYYPGSQTIGVYDNLGFLGSVITPSTLWTMVESESKHGSGYNRLLLDVPAGFEPARPGEPDWRAIEQIFKNLDGEALWRKQRRERPESLTLAELDIDWRFPVD